MSASNQPAWPAEANGRWQEVVNEPWACGRGRWDSRSQESAGYQWRPSSGAQSHLPTCAAMSRACRCQGSIARACQWLHWPHGPTALPGLVRWPAASCKGTHGARCRRGSLTGAESCFGLLPSRHVGAGRWSWNTATVLAFLTPGSPALGPRCCQGATAAPDAQAAAQLLLLSAASSAELAYSQRIWDSLSL